VCVCVCVCVCVYVCVCVCVCVAVACGFVVRDIAVVAFNSNFHAVQLIKMKERGRKEFVRV